ncbi:MULTISPECIES: DivIVA domain-containing protein [Carboxydocella]|uniref:Cell division initiation protein n=2 Tax=Carboxydocella TaxID=178898 RepID=A0A1T4M9W9_9FIRM|nr:MULTISPECIES: DivIVA domain-containing protein [Carboxydocella]AVX20980.1 cell division initiation protein [Carboxydocella thermautotrophica]GAW28122.1 septum formation initiator [Carboxydocella sp. ULO1]GAW30984.1 septum formation initiator [Carboxydocella sp. JDF658]SJZ63685.1 cell division initiation protein [Carboxydocella sporoproducens DSM 16521]
MAQVKTPLDYKNPDFERGFRGYSPEAVDKYVAELLADYEKIYKENLELKEQLASRELSLSHYKRLEDDIKEALVLARRTADDLRRAAETEATAIRAAAEKDASQLISQAKERVKDILQEQEELLKLNHKLRTELKAMLQAYLDLLEKGTYFATETKQE